MWSHMNDNPIYKVLFYNKQMVPRKYSKQNPHGIQRLWILVILYDFKIKCIYRLGHFQHSDKTWVWRVFTILNSLSLPLLDVNHDHDLHRKIFFCSNAILIKMKCYLVLYIITKQESNFCYLHFILKGLNMIKKKGFRV